MSIEAIITIFVVVFVISLFLYYLPKIKVYFTKLIKKKKKDKEKKEIKVVKPSKVVENIRPVLKPANGQREKEELKQLEFQKQNKKVEVKDKDKSSPEILPQRSIDFKYSPSSRPVFSSSNADSEREKFVQPRIAFSANRSDIANRDMQKEFEDIKKFLDLPTKKEDKPSNFNTNFVRTPKPYKDTHKIDPSIFNETGSDFADYRTSVTPNKNAPKKSVYINEKLDDAVLRTNTKYARPVSSIEEGPYNVRKSFFEPTNSTLKRDNNLVVKNNKIDLSEFKVDNNLEAKSKSLKRNLNYERDDYLNFEEENIDLNKLSPRLKRLIITNILERKKFD